MSKEERALVQKAFKKLERSLLRWEKNRRGRDVLWCPRFDKPMELDVLNKVLDRFTKKYPRVSVLSPLDPRFTLLGEAKVKGLMCCVSDGV